MQLEENTEIIGVLKSIEKHGYGILLTFSITKTVVIPYGIKEKIEEFLNKKIGILNLENTYYLRKIKEV